MATDLLLNPRFVEWWQGEDFKFDAGPGTLSGGFVVATDQLTFRAKRNMSDTSALITVGPFAPLTTQVARVQIPANTTVNFGEWPVELHWVLSILRGGETYDLLGGEARVYPSARNS